MVKSLDEVIERLQYKADNIKAKLEPSYFTECIDYLKVLNSIEHYSETEELDGYGYGCSNKTCAETVRNKAIDEFAEYIEWEATNHWVFDLEDEEEHENFLDEIRTIAEQLKVEQ